MTGKEFKKTRKNSGFSQIQFGQLLGISDALVSAIENGRKPVSKNTEAKMLLLFPDPERVGLSFSVLGTKIVQVQANGSTVGNLLAHPGGWDYRPAGMAAQYGKEIEGNFTDIESFLEWWEL